MSFLDGTANTATPQPQRSHNTQTRHKPQTSSSRAYPAARPTAPLRSSAPGAPACATCVADSDDVSVTLHIMPCHLRLEHCSQITGSSPLWPRVGRGGEPFRALLRAYSAPSSHPRGRWSASPARRWRACSRPRLRDTSSSARGREAWPGEPSRCPSTVGKPRARLLLPDGDRGHAPAAKGVDGDRRDGRRFPPPLLPAARPCGQPSAGRGTAVRRGATRTHAAGGRGAPHLRQEAAQGARDAAETQPRRSPTHLRQDAPPEARATRRLHVGRTSAAPRPHLCHLSLAHRLGRCATGSACPTRRRWPSCARRRWSTRPSGGCTARCTSSRRWRLPAGLACRQEASPLTRHGRVGRLRAQDVWHQAAGVRLVPPRLGGSHRLRTYTTDAHSQQPTDPGHQPLPPTRPHTAADPDTLHPPPRPSRRGKVLRETFTLKREDGGIELVLSVPNRSYLFYPAAVDDAFDAAPPPPRRRAAVRRLLTRREAANRPSTAAETSLWPSSRGRRPHPSRRLASSRTARPPRARRSFLAAALTRLAVSRTRTPRRRRRWSRRRRCPRCPPPPPRWRREVRAAVH